MTQKLLNQLAFDVVGCAIRVHQQVGPGLLESVYEDCLSEELEYHKFSIQRQCRVPIVYRSKTLNTHLKLDILVENQLIIEVKAVEVVLPVFNAQLLSYMNLLEKPRGVLINFHTENISQNCRHFVNKHYNARPHQ